MTPEQYSRLTLEVEDLEARTDALHRFIASPEARELSTSDQNLLNEQLRCMTDYLNVAKKRLDQSRVNAAAPQPVDPVPELVADILAELKRARAKFPGPNVTMLALMEEVGELATAVFEEPRANVRAEAVQVASMAMRVVLDGDETVTQWRADRGLDPIVAP